MVTTVEAIAFLRKITKPWFCKGDLFEQPLPQSTVVSKSKGDVKDILPKVFDNLADFSGHAGYEKGSLNHRKKDRVSRPYLFIPEFSQAWLFQVIMLLITSEVFWKRRGAGCCCRLASQDPPLPSSPGTRQTGSSGSPSSSLFQTWASQNPSEVLSWGLV